MRGVSDNLMSLLLYLFNALQGIPFVVAFGGDLSRLGADTSPFDARAGVRLHNNNPNIHDGINPTGGGPIVTWTFRQTYITPNPNPNLDLFEYSWVEISRDGGVDIIVSPVAASTWQDLGGTMKIWYARKTSSGAISAWVIDITVREKADTGNTDTIRMTMEVEGAF